MQIHYDYLDVEADGRLAVISARSMRFFQGDPYCLSPQYEIPLKYLRKPIAILLLAFAPVVFHCWKGRNLLTENWYAPVIIFSFIGWALGCMIQQYLATKAVNNYFEKNEPRLWRMPEYIVPCEKIAKRTSQLVFLLAISTVVIFATVPSAFPLSCAFILLIANCGLSVIPGREIADFSPRLRRRM